MADRSYSLPNGAVLDLIGLVWTSRGQLFTQAKITAPDGAVLSDSHLDLSDQTARYRVSIGLSSRNGASAEDWESYLLMAYSLLADEKNTQIAPFAPYLLAEMEIPGPVTWLWQGLAAEKTITSIYGDSGQGKSTIVDAIAVCVAAGIPFLERHVEGGDAVILDWELTRDFTLRRLDQLARGFGLRGIPDGLYYQGLTTGPLPHYLPDILEWCDKIQPALIIVDSMGIASGGNPIDHERVIGLMNAMRQLPTSTIAVDHQPKAIPGRNYSSNSEFGSAFKRALVRSSIQVEMTSNVKGKASLILRQQKTNFGPAAQPILVHMLFERFNTIRFEMGSLADPEYQDSASASAEIKILKFLEEKVEATKQEIIDGTGIKHRRFDNVISQLKKAGKVESTKGSGSIKTKFRLRGNTP